MHCKHKNSPLCGTLDNFLCELKLPLLLSSAREAAFIFQNPTTERLYSEPRLGWAKFWENPHFWKRWRLLPIPLVTRPVPYINSQNINCCCSYCLLMYKFASWSELLCVDVVLDVIVCMFSRLFRIFVFLLQQFHCFWSLFFSLLTFFIFVLN